MQEIWKDIRGYEGLYQVSNFGNVKSLMFINNIVKIKRDKILYKSTRSGYYTVNLCKNGKRLSKQVHRLVAEAFIPNPNNKKIVNHKDFDRKNNYVDNLEWLTQQENILYSRYNMSKPRLKYKKSSTGIKYITKRGNSFRVQFKNIKIDKNFKSLIDAIHFRNEVIKNNEEYFSK